MVNGLTLKVTKLPEDTVASTFHHGDYDSITEAYRLSSGVERGKILPHDITHPQRDITGV